MKYHRLTVVESVDAGHNRFNQKQWLCHCECGATTLVLQSDARTGHTKSCGCLQVSGTRRTHGQRGNRSKAYSTWCNLKNRCDSPKTPQWKDYGGRGITYDPSWAKFENFYQDMGDPPDASYSIDRIDNNGNYSKDNCRWADRETQRRNNSQSMVWLTINGEDMILTDAVKKYGVVSFQQANLRVWQGWDPVRAVTTPIKAAKRYTVNGETLTLPEWSKKTGIGRVTLIKRLQAGVPPDIAFTTMGNMRRKKTEPVDISHFEEVPDEPTP